MIRNVINPALALLAAGVLFTGCEKSNDTISQAEPPSILPPGEGTWKPPGLVQAN